MLEGLKKLIGLLVLDLKTIESNCISHYICIDGLLACTEDGILVVCVRDGEAFDCCGRRIVEATSRVLVSLPNRSSCPL
jgi:hypothetical protein